MSSLFPRRGHSSNASRTLLLSHSHGTGGHGRKPSCCVDVQYGGDGGVGAAAPSVTSQWSCRLTPEIHSSALHSVCMQLWRTLSARWGEEEEEEGGGRLGCHGDGSEVASGPLRLVEKTWHTYCIARRRTTKGDGISEHPRGPGFFSSPYSASVREGCTNPPVTPESQDSG